MKLAILSRNTKLYSTQRLVEAGRQRGHVVRVLDPLRCYMQIAPGKFLLHYKGKPLASIDAVIPRIGASVTFYGTAVLRQFELMGAYSPNGSDAVLRARDKLRCHQILAGEGLGLPVTVFGDNPDDTGDLLGMLGKPPHVIKLNEGTQGTGVILAENAGASRSVIEAFRGLYANFLVQEFIAEAKGSDVRCFVVGDRVVAAMRRQAGEGEFRSNLHRGGKALKVKLSAAEIATALKAARVLGLGVAGVDLLRSKRGPLVLEVNSSPGLEGIEGATGVDVAGAIVEFVASQVRPKAPAGRKSSKSKRRLTKA
ncbi:MAG: 30S ribosomal protein S6--L-glutamate ligase [Arenimonas sp.]|nr:30S ribosomal protein S6--L-glutamate ligase [Arenimonas sp.]